MIIKLRETSYHLLVEAIHEYRCSKKAHLWTLEDIKHTKVGSGYTGKFAPATEDGFMRLIRYTSPGKFGYFRLTNIGAKIVLAWHKLGYEDFKDSPPKDVEVDIRQSDLPEDLNKEFGGLFVVTQDEIEDGTFVLSEKVHDDDLSPDDYGRFNIVNVDALLLETANTIPDLRRKFNYRLDIG